MPAPANRRTLPLRKIDQSVTVSWLPQHTARGGSIVSLNVINLAGAAIFVKFYDVSEVAGVVVGTTAVAKTIFVAANLDKTLLLLGNSFDFINGIAMRVCTGGADADNTASATLPIIELETI